jgi:hypothetical protein
VGRLVVAIERVIGGLERDHSRLVALAQWLEQLSIPVD